MEAKQQVDARKIRIEGQEALQMLDGIDELYVAKGKRVVLVALNDHASRPKDEELLSLLLGPSGNLRAPTLRVGRKLIVGFHGETYESVLLKRK